MSQQMSPPRGGIRIVTGAAALALSGLLLVRATGPWPGDAIVWPAVAAVAGALLLLRQPQTAPRLHRRPSWAAHRPPEPEPEPAPTPAAPRALRRLGRPELSRSGLGIALVLGAAFAFLWANGALRPAGEVVLAALVALVAMALIFAPSLRRLASSLAAERAERIRMRERADVGAHLHDSVLQTLALIQRSAEDPGQVAALARRQERELRSWLAGEAPGSGEDRLAAALDAAAAQVESAAGVPVEVVSVGDCGLDDRALAMVAAAREAMLNAAKFAGAGPVSVYAEVSGERAQVFVRDRGDGFDVEAVPAERRGVRDSIVGRMRRVGGSASIRSAPGEGTEVELVLERRGET